MDVETELRRDGQDILSFEHRKERYGTDSTVCGTVSRVTHTFRHSRLKLNLLLRYLCSPHLNSPQLLQIINYRIPHSPLLVGIREFLLHQTISGPVSGCHG